MAASRPSEGRVFGTAGIYTKIKEMTLKYNKSLVGRVGYSAPYAAYVHEDLTANHPNGGQAKYLEQPAREYRTEIAAIVVSNLKNKESLETALRRSLNFLLVQSQELAPVKTGFLRDSGFVEVTAK